MTTVDREEVVVLTEALIEGSITAEEFARLEQWLKGDPLARDLYLEHRSLDSCLNWRWQPESEKVSVAVGGDRPGNVFDFPVLRHFSRAAVAGAAAVVAALLVAGLFLSIKDKGGQFAEVAAGEGTQWRVVSGAKDRSGRQTLLVTEGVLEVAFASGARATLQGPTLFEVRGGNEAMMEWGQGSFQVPGEASGYSVATPWGRVVDLGTAFDLSVTNNGLAEVVVREGKVRLIASGGNKGRRDLLAGESLAMSRSGLSEGSAARGGGRPDGTAGQSAYQQMIREAQPVAYWPFDGEEGTLITEKGIVRIVPGPRPPGFPAFAADNTAAFFGERGMLRIQDRGEDSPFDFDNGDEISIEAWVNPDDQVHEGGIVYIVGKGRTDNLAFLKDNQNFSLRLWKVDGKMKTSFLFRSAADGEWQGDYHRWTTLRGFDPGSGWHHVAATYRYGSPDSIRTYQDGELMPGEWDMGGASDRRPVMDDDEVWLGAAKGGAEGNKFTGMVDEVAIYRTILTAEQIQQRVRGGKRGE